MDIYLVKSKVFILSLSSLIIRINTRFLLINEELLLIKFVYVCSSHLQNNAKNRGYNKKNALCVV